MEKLDIMEKSVARIANGFDALFGIDAPTCTNDEQQGPPNISPSTQTTSNAALFSNGPTSQSVPVAPSTQTTSNAALFSNGPTSQSVPVAPSTQTASNAALFSNRLTSQSVPVEDFHVNEPIITLSARTVTSIREQSCSRQNFAVNMVRALYTQDERTQSNVSGRKGKMKLEPQKMGMVKVSTFQMYPCGVGETAEKAWGMCIKSIDESCRRMYRKDRAVQAEHTEYN